MSGNPLLKAEDPTPCLLLNKRQAATALSVSTRIVEALERRGDIESVQIPPCFPKANPTAKSRRGPQPMKRYPVDSLRAYVARLRAMSVDQPPDSHASDRDEG